MSLQLNQQSSVLYCAKYAYRPNRLGYCGPDQNKELFQYIKAEETDAGLIENLEKFETLHPYLRHIAHTNKEKNLFNEKVVRAYWVGNNFLENSGGARLFYHLIDDLKIKKKLTKKSIEELGEKIPVGANAHHSFHVFNIWKRTGHTENLHTLYTMDECRIGWGKTESLEGNIINVLYRPLIFKNGQLVFGEIISKKIFYEFGKVNIGDWISFHWSSFCEVLSEEDVAQLKYWTNINLRLANYGR
ncbi:MAG: hypothetical protein COU51_00090 [Parcubacteria group bacterium CG10_big_fil_rev_8_21_14_0_10_36_14]|nr:MAG: hypothetical protein COU51_00090 [Parcubacteria group bacterium CG10_big_fil_rev_8_21_14_0_10_36_14]